MGSLRTIVETESYQNSAAVITASPPRLDDALAGIMFALATNPGEVGHPTSNPEIRVITTVPLNGDFYSIYYWFTVDEVILKEMVAYAAAS